MNILQDIKARKKCLDFVAEEIAKCFFYDVKNAIFSIPTSDCIFYNRWLLVQLNHEEGKIRITPAVHDYEIVSLECNKEIELSSDESFTSLPLTYQNVCKKYTFNKIIAFLNEQGFENLENTIPTETANNVVHTEDEAFEWYVLEI